MAIIAYPLNGIQYSAEDAQTYLCTRTSGVYSAENHFSLGEVTADRRITIGAGLAWMKISEFGGISFAVTEPVTVSVEGADANIDRTDLIVLRYDGNSQEPEERKKVICKKNSNSVQQSDGIFELALYRIVIPAGSTQIIASQIEDVRATPLCGVMKDGVTGIPVNTLVEEFRAKVNNSINSLEEDAENALNKFETDAGDALEDFDNDATSRLSDFSANANIKFTEFAQMSQRLESNATQAIADMQQTEAEFNTAVNNANQAVDNFNSTTVPNAINNFNADGKNAIDSFNAEVDVQLEAFSNRVNVEVNAFKAEANTSIEIFESNSEKAIADVEDAVQNIASGTDVMLQTAFNPSGKVGQVAFEGDASYVVVGTYYDRFEERGENYYILNFFKDQNMQSLQSALKDGKNIILRLFPRALPEGVTEGTSSDLPNVFYFFRGMLQVPFESFYDVRKKVFTFYLQDTSNSFEDGGEMYFYGIINSAWQKITLIKQDEDFPKGNILPI